MGKTYIDRKQQDSIMYTALIVLTCVWAYITFFVRPTALEGLLNTAGITIIYGTTRVLTTKKYKEDCRCEE